MSKKLAKSRMSRVLGVTSTGFPIFAISGAEGGDEDTQTGSNSETTDDKTTTDTGEESPEESGDSKPKSYDEEYVEKLIRRLSAADKAKGDMEKKLREIDESKLDELEKTKRALAEAEQRVADLSQENLRGKMANAILQYPGYTWHDPEVVLQLVDMDDIEVDPDTGKVKGVRDALAKLAKDKPFLLKGKTDSGSKDNGKSITGQNGASGHNPQNNKPDDKNARRQELAEKYKLRR